MAQYKWLLKDEVSGNVFQLERDPKGWERLSKKIYRSASTDGIFMEPSVKEFTFLTNGGGAEFIQTVFAATDVNSRILMTCYIKRNSTDIFNPAFVCMLNLSDILITTNGVKVKVEQSSLYQKMLSRQETSVNLQTHVSIGEESITPISPVTIAMPGTKIFMQSKWVVDDESRSYDDGGHFPGTTFNGILVEDDTLKRDELDEGRVGIISQDWGTPTTDFTASSAAPIFVFNKSDLLNDSEIFTVKWDYSGILSIGFGGLGGGVYTNTGTAVLKVAYGPDKASAIVTDLFTVSWTDNNFVDTIDFADANNTAISLNVGDSVWLFWEVTILVTHVSGTIGTVFTSLGINYGYREFSLSVNSEYAATTAKVYPVHEAFNAIVDAIADSDGNFYSELYGRTDSSKVTYGSDGEQSLLAVTGGLPIREFDKPIVVSFKTLFESCKALHNIGMGIVDGKVRIEKLEAFYKRNTRIVTLHKVKDYEKKLAGDRYINQVFTGFEQWETEFKGGLEDPCGKHEYSTKIHTLKAPYTAVSAIIGSPYAIEATRRRNINRAPTEDWRYDNDNFFIALVRDGADLRPELYADSFSAGANMADMATALNLRLTPKRMLLAHFNRIAAGLQIVEGDVRLAKGEGNTAMQIAKTDIGHQEDYSGVVLGEDADLAYNDSNVANKAPLWKPFLFTLEYTLTPEQWQAIENDPYGFVEFYKEPTSIKRGYIIDAEHNYDDGITKFTLLERYGN